MENKYTPDIRFRGYEDSWDIFPLSAYLTTSHEKNKSNIYSKDDVMSVSREFGVVNQIEYQGKSLAGASVSGYGVAQTNDIIYTKSPLRDQPYGIIKTSCIPTGIVSALYAVYHPNDNVCPQFVQTYFENDDRLNAYLQTLVRKGAKNTLNVSDEDALKGNVCFPKKEEQEQILTTFKVVDEGIAKQRLLCEQLRRLKSALLDKLFPKVGTDKPELRFENHTQDWHLVSLSKYAQRIKRKNKDLESSLVLTISSQYGLIDQLEFFNKSVSGSDLTNYYLLHKGDFAYNKSYSSGFPWGSVKRLDLYDCGIVSNLYIIFSVSDIDSDYVTTFFMTDRWYEQLSMLAKEGARNHGLLNVSANDFLNIDIQVPRDSGEMKEIGQLIKTYDRLISLNEKKLEKLRNLKSAMLDKLFV